MGLTGTLGSRFREPGKACFPHHSRRLERLLPLLPKTRTSVGSTEVIQHCHFKNREPELPRVPDARQ